MGTTSVEEVYAYEYDVEYDLRMRLGGFGVLRDEHETASTQTHKKVVRLEDCLHQTLEAAASPVLEVSTDSKVFAAATTVAVALGTAATCGALTAVRTAVSLGATAGRAGAAVSAAAASRKATAVAAPDATPEAPAAADVEAGEDAATAPAVGAPEARAEPQKRPKLGAHTCSISFARSRILRLASPLRRLGSAQFESRHVQEPDPPPSWDRRGATVPSPSSFAPPAPTPAADEDHGSFEA